MAALGCQVSSAWAAGPPERIDILVDAVPAQQGPEFEDCSAEEEAASISGEIVVCRRKVDQSQYRTVTEDEAENRYARQTMDKGSPRPPDVFGIPNHGVPIRFGKVPPPAYMVDFSALPDTPPGSDADRVGRGLPPLGRDTAAAAANPAQAKELGLPPVPDFRVPPAAPPVNPSGSASPAEEPSG